MDRTERAKRVERLQETIKTLQWLTGLAEAPPAHPLKSQMMVQLVVAASYCAQFEVHLTNGRNFAEAMDLTLFGAPEGVEQSDELNMLIKNPLTGKWE